MGGLFHIFEFNQGSMAKKVHSHKRHHGGQEAPRNSLEQQVEASQACCCPEELPHHYQVEEDWSANNRYSNVASMKKLISEELSKRSNTRQNAPSVVARLMGIDMMPLDTKSVIWSDERKDGNMGKKFLKKEMDGRASVGRSFSNSSSSIQIQFDSFYQHIDDDGWHQSFGKPRRREHPQEEELKKFKKAFEVYQAARFMECYKVVDLGSVSRRLLAQENLNREKMAHCANNQRVATEKPAKLKNYSFKSQIDNGGYAEYHDDMMEFIPAKQRGFLSSRSKTLSRDFEESLLMKSSGRLDRLSPTRIVILKPGPDRICNQEENWKSSSGTLQGRNSIEDFLEEVGERLKCELQGNGPKKGSVVRGRGIETPHNEKPDPKKIARHIAKRIRESVTRDVGTNLPRSESTRSYRNEIQFDEPSSPEFMNRNTRKFLSQRLRNVLKSESHLDISEVASGNSKSYVLENHRVSMKQAREISKGGNPMSQWEISKEGKEMQTGSLRHERDDNILLHRERSPRNLVRSLSAPVSGTSFGKLLQEDRHILTGARIRRRLELEAVETVSAEARKWKKERFNIKEKVSNFKYSLVQRGKLFGKRIQTMAESHGNEHGPMVRDITSEPTVLLNYVERLENSTEVPPSPASVCSSAQEELRRQAEYSSPTSTPGVSSRDDNVVPQIFRDISANLNALRRQLNQLESDAPYDFTIKQETYESELVQLQDPAESYVRNLLVASGLYFGSWDKSLLRGDTFSKPIGNSVFEEVEESHRKSAKENESSIKDQKEHKLEHKILLDLLNEALSIVLGSPPALRSFGRKLSSSFVPLPPSGKELLKLVWDIICVSLYPLSSNSLDNLVARDLGSIPWSAWITDEITILEREIECLISEDLIKELTKDMLLDVV